MPITMSRTASPPVKCVSVWGVIGIAQAAPARKLLRGLLHLREQLGFAASEQQQGEPVHAELGVARDARRGVHARRRRDRDLERSRARRAASPRCAPRARPARQRARPRDRARSRTSRCRAARRGGRGARALPAHVDRRVRALHRARLRIDPRERDVAPRRSAAAAASRARRSRRGTRRSARRAPRTARRARRTPLRGSPRRCRRAGARPTARRGSPAPSRARRGFAAAG